MNEKRYYSTRYDMIVDVREHGDWKFWDFWLRLFVWIVSISKEWKKNYYSSFTTVSVITKTAYTYDVVNVPDYILDHECCHLQQFKDDRLMPLKYILSARKRVDYEAEAYHVNNELELGNIARTLKTYYFLPFWWSVKKVESRVLAKIKEIQ